MRNMSNSVWIVWSVVTASLACVNQPTKEAAVGKRQSALTPSTAFEIVKKIPVGVSPQKVVLSSDGNTAYVSNYGANSVSVVDLASGTQVAVYPVGSLPLALALGPGGTTLYVGQNGGGVSAIHLASGAVTAIDTSGFPVRDLAIPPGGSRAYLAMEFGGLRAIELATGTVSTIPSVGGCPEGLAVTPDGSRLFVNYQCGGPGSSGGGHDAIGVFDAVTGAFITSIVGLANVGGGIATDGNLILAQGGDACIQPAYDHVGCPVLGAGITNVIDAVSLTPFAPLPNGNGFSFAPNQAFLLSGGDALQILDYQTRATVQTIPVAASGLVAFSADGKQFYAPVPGENVLAVVSVGSAQGAACGTGADCASTFCVDGVCCASAACGSCHSCNGPGIPGTCTLVPAGLPDPKGICGDQGAASCGTNGRCDGTGGCQKYASGTQCVPPSCPNGSSTKTLAKTCDGQGACANGGTTVSCGAFLCNGINDCLHNCRSTADCVTPNLCDLKNNLCGSRKPAGCMCMTTSECQTGLFCTGGVCCDSITSGTCAPLPAGSPGCGTSGTGGSSGTGGTSGTGASCVAAADCASGFCVDGVCCDSACGAGDPNDCQACSVTAGAATNGTCGPRPSGGVCGATPGICQTAGICGGGPTCSGPTTIPGCAPATIPSGCAGSCDPIELRGGLAVESGITVEFQGGASAGQISVNACDATSPPPTGYKVIDGMNGKYCWDLKVSASVSYTTPPPIIVCIHYPEAIAANENVFQMAHDDGSGVFAMNTTDRFPDDNIICGFAYSLSPFAIVLPL
ncbi:MAG TPA: hypothetical protein VNO55_30335, partial [Polyangia bacterium]|nr:hypothetical protein [Polyangia bacterium]